MFKVIESSKEIISTRGDVGCINVTAKSTTKTEEGEVIKTPYEFKVDDVVRLTVVKKGDYSQVVLTKDVVVTEPATMVRIFLDNNDTTIGEVISKPVVYWYEIELNPDTNPQTIIGHDKETGAKIFTLCPEGRK